MFLLLNSMPDIILTCRWWVFRYMMLTICCLYRPLTLTDMLPLWCPPSDSNSNRLTEFWLLQSYIARLASKPRLLNNSSQKTCYMLVTAIRRGKTNCNSNYLCWILFLEMSSITYPKSTEIHLELIIPWGQSWGINQWKMSPCYKYFGWLYALKLMILFQTDVKNKQYAQ